MPHGFQLLGSALRVQVDQDFKAPRLIASGSSVVGSPLHYIEVELPFDIYGEPPIVMVRPAEADKYVGAFICGKGDWTPFSGMTNGGMALYGQCAFDYAIFSTLGTAVSDGSAFGIEVYKDDGSIAFSSRHQHPRLRALLPKAASTASDGGYPNAFTISGFSSMPWLLANPLIVTAFGVGPDGESMGAVMGAVNSDHTTLTVDLRNFGDPTLPLASVVYPASVEPYNPYHGLPAWFAVGTFT